MKTMPKYSFRIRFRIPSRERVEIGEAELDISLGSGKSLKLISGDLGKSIREASFLVVKADGYPDETSARIAAERTRDVLTIVFAKLKIGVDFGDRGPQSSFLEAGLNNLKQQVGQRVINDHHGVMIYESQPTPRFARISGLSLIRGRNEAQFMEILHTVASQEFMLSDRERLAYDLFSASYFQESEDARFIMLVISLECLLDLEPRTGTTLEHVERLIELTKTSRDIPNSDRNSILGSLNWLRDESIRHAAHRFVRNRLGDRTYSDMLAEKFAVYCYDLRSRLVHGSKNFPTRDEVAKVVANLETMVGDLLAEPYIQTPD